MHLQTFQTAQTSALLLLWKYVRPFRFTLIGMLAVSLNKLFSYLRKANFTHSSLIWWYALPIYRHIHISLLRAIGVCAHSQCKELSSLTCVLYLFFLLLCLVFCAQYSFFIFFSVPFIVVYSSCLFLHVYLCCPCVPFHLPIPKNPCSLTGLPMAGRGRVWLSEVRGWRREERGTDCETSRHQTGAAVRPQIWDTQNTGKRPGNAI